MRVGATAPPPLLPPLPSTHIRDLEVVGATWIYGFSHPPLSLSVPTSPCLLFSSLSLYLPSLYLPPLSAIPIPIISISIHSPLYLTSIGSTGN